MQIKLYNSFIIFHMCVTIVFLGGGEVKSKWDKIIYNFIFSFSIVRPITLTWLKSNPVFGGQYLNVKGNNWLLSMKHGSWPGTMVLSIYKGVCTGPHLPD